MSFEIKYVKKSRLAHEPKMATSGSAGCDLFAAEDKVIKPQSTEYVSVSVQCHKNIKNDCNNIDSMNNKWMKFCFLRPALDNLNFNGNMRFFSFNDIIDKTSIFWCYRESRIKKK